jgi:hypothetical protein
MPTEELLLARGSEEEWLEEVCLAMVMETTRPMLMAMHRGRYSYVCVLVRS